MRENNNFNQYPTYPGETVDERMDNRVGINEQLIDAEPYNGEKTNKKKASIELIEEDGQWKRFDNDGYVYSDREAVIATSIVFTDGATKTIKAGETYVPEFTVTPFTANLPNLSLYKETETPEDESVIGSVVIINNGTILGVQPGTCVVLAKDGLSGVYAEITITVTA